MRAARGPAHGARQAVLVAPRGYTQWVRNAEASGDITLRRGGRAEGYRLRVLSDTEKPPILKAYLDRFRREVQRYFPVPAGSPVERFSPLADDVFAELQSRKSMSAGITTLGASSISQ